MGDNQENVLRKENVALVMLDSSSAFDTVDHELLLNKLEFNFGIKGKALQLIQSYLQERTFSVKVGNTQSQPKRVLFGVPQGSLLGPLFYILYTKELEVVVKECGFKLHMYADDCQIYLSFTDAGSLTMTRFNECLKNVKIWMDKNALKLNADKTKLKVFSPKNQLSNFNLSFENSVIEPSDTVDILGVKLGQNINYASFISKKVQVISFHLRNLQHVKESLNVHTKTLLIKNLVLSNLDYCNSLLICATDKDLKPLKMLLNRAVRFICNVP